MRFLGAKGYSPNFIHKIVSLLKTIMQEGADRGLHSNMLFRSPKFTVKRYEPEHVYLSEEELGRIAALDLSKKARLDKVRDLFLIGCYTGLRFSDYSRLKPENLATFDGLSVLTIETRKTKKRVYVPILAPVKAILEKHGGVPPAGISNQKMNTYLKELARLAGIVEQIQVNSVRGAQRIQTVVEKCDLISTHTARRSFASNEYLRAVKEGRSFRPIMDILGMSKEATFLRYVKVDRLAALVDWVRGR